MNARVQEPNQQATEPPDSESCWALLERVVASPQMKRAARMREFLLFVGQRSLKDGCEQIPEQEIGSEVFGRPAEYDTSVDNIVRVNATDLRKRIEDYFATDGANEPLILEIPRGSYKPVFRRRAAKPTETAATTTPTPFVVASTAAPATQPEPVPRSSRLLAALMAVLVLALASGCGW